MAALSTDVLVIGGGATGAGVAWDAALRGESLLSRLERLQNANIFIDDSGALNPLELRARARRLYRSWGKVGLIAGDYTVVASKANYVTATAATTIANDATVARNLTLATPQAVVNAAPLSFLAQPGQLRSTTIALSNPSTSVAPARAACNAKAPWLQKASSTRPPRQYFATAAC